MRGWGLVAGVVIAYDALAAKRGARLLSHDWWDALESEWGFIPAGVWSAVTWHLFLPRRKWSDAVAIGALIAVAHRITVR